MVIYRFNEQNFSDILSNYRTPIMGIAMICIMLYHQTWVLNGFFMEWIHLLGYIGVEIFLFLSGFGLVHSLSKNNLNQFYRHRIKRILPACFVFGILKISLSFIPTMPKVSNFFLDLLGLSHWYIYAIVIYYLVSPILYKIIKKYGWYPLIAISIISFFIVYIWKADTNAPYFIKYARWILKRFPVFILGMTIALRPINWRLSTYLILGILFLGLNIISLHFIIGVNANGLESTNIINRFFYLVPNRTDIPDNGRYLLDMLSVFGLCLTFSFAAYISSKFHFLSILNWFGIYSLELYLCHQYVFKVFLEHSIGNPYIELLISCITSVVVAYIIKVISQMCCCSFYSIIQNNKIKSYGR